MAKLMPNKYLVRSLIFGLLIGLLLVSNLPSSALHMRDSNYYQAPPDHINLIILVKASKSTNDPINTLEGNPKTKLQVIQDAVKSVLETYNFPSNVNIGVIAYGHKLIRDYDKSCKVDNVEEVIPFQPFSNNIDLLPFTSISGMGDAPTTVALTEAAKKFPQDSSVALNAILLIAEGTDSCGQNPDEEAKILAERQQIVIYTIGLSTNDVIEAELSAIAENSNGQYSSIPNHLSASQRATDELAALIMKALDDLVSQTSPSIPSNTPVPPTNTNVAPRTEPVTVIAPTAILPSEVPLPTSTPLIVESPSESRSLFILMILAIIGLLVFLLYGYIYWKANLRGVTPRVRYNENDLQKPKDYSTIKDSPGSKEIDISKVDLEIFLQEIHKSYASFGNGGRYILLEQLKQKFSATYTEDQFNQLLILTRQKFPNKIWVDKNSQGKTIVKIVI